MIQGHKILHRHITTFCHTRTGILYNSIHIIMIPYYNAPDNSGAFYTKYFSFWDNSYTNIGPP